MVLIVPPTLEAALQVFDQTSGPIDMHEVARALQQARRELVDLPAPEQRGAWADLLATSLTPWPGNPSPWGTFYGPLATLQNDAGQEFHQPDIAGADDEILEHWRTRASVLVHPTLKARYADLVWDLGPTISGSRRRDSACGRLAFDNHMAAAAIGSDAFSSFQALRRALLVALALRDTARIDLARGAILAFHRSSPADGGLDWQAYDLLLAQTKAKLAAGDLDTFIAELEDALARHAEVGESGRFDPHRVDGAATRLIAHYRRHKARDDEKRVHSVVARAAEHQAGLASALLASSLLNDSFEAYRKAGLLDDAERVRRLMECKVQQSAAEMGEFRQEIRITFEEAEAFKIAIVSDDPAETFARIAVEFLLRRAALEDQIAKQAEVAPLMAMLTQTIIDGDRVVASVGSVEDDPYGRVLRQALMSLRLNTIWLSWAIEAAIERHRFHAGHFTAWVNRAGLFGDGALLAEGLNAWLDGDTVKAMHVLTPQVERGLRALVGASGRPTTKPHPAFKGAHVAVTMGDILYNKETVAAFGPAGDDLAVHLAALYADPRGLNLRNDLAHGLMGLTEFHDGNVLWIVHTLILLGLWRNPGPP